MPKEKPNKQECGRRERTLASGGQGCCPLGLLHSALGQILWFRPQNWGPGSVQPSQATPGAGEDLWSHFLSTLASFFTSLKISYFHHSQFLLSPVQRLFPHRRSHEALVRLPPGPPPLQPQVPEVLS